MPPEIPQVFFPAKEWSRIAKESVIAVQTIDNQMIIIIIITNNNNNSNAFIVQQ